MNKIINILKDKKFFIIRFLIVFIIFTYSVYFQLIPIKLLNIDINSISGEMSVLLSAFSSIILVFILYFIYRKDLKREFKIFKKDIIGNLDIGFKYWFL